MREMSACQYQWGKWGQWQRKEEVLKDTDPLIAMKKYKILSQVCLGVKRQQRHTLTNASKPKSKNLLSLRLLTLRSWKLCHAQINLRHAYNPGQLSRILLHLNILLLVFIFLFFPFFFGGKKNWFNYWKLGWIKVEYSST